MSHHVPALRLFVVIGDRSVVAGGYSIIGAAGNMQFLSTLSLTFNTIEGLGGCFCIHPVRVWSIGPIFLVVQTFDVWTIVS
jgi:hypothetical protein